MNFGLNTAVTGLLAAQRGLYTAGHNTDNTTTPGYSRQVVFQSATNAQFIPKDGFLGTGTNIYNIERVRDTYVDFKYRNERPATEEWKVKNTNLDEVQKILSEPSETSFRKYLDDLYSSLETMSKNPGDLSYREPIRENATAFCRHINEVASKLIELEKTVLQESFNAVEQVNSLAEQIAELNRQIAMSETDGRMANDLRDRRDLMIDELSQYVNITVTEEPVEKVDEKDKKKKLALTRMDISVGGISLVNHIYASKINLVKVDYEPATGKKIDPNDKDYDAHEPYVLQWTNGGKVDIRTGQIKGLLDLYNGNGKNNSFRGVRHYKNKLDEFAEGFTRKFNEQHAKGFTMDNKQGVNFFEVLPANGVQAALKMKVSKEVLNDIKNIAAAEELIATPLEAGKEDNRNILALIKQREDIKFFSEGVSQGTPEDFIKSVVSIVGVDKQQANRFYDTQRLLEKNLENRRLSISGVNLDEEMGDMVKFQKVYIASAKMISTLDGLLDVTVNRLGLVGR